MASKPSETKDALVTIRLPARLHRALTKRAKKEGVVMSVVIRNLLVAGLADGRATDPSLRAVLDEVDALRRDLGVRRTGRSG